MKKILLAEVAMICLFAMAFLPKEGFAQTPGNAEIYYYKYCNLKNGEEICEYKAVQFLDGAIKVCDSKKGMSLGEFKRYAQNEIKKKEKADFSSNSSKDGKKVYTSLSEMSGWETFEFSQSYNMMVYTWDMFYYGETNQYVRVQ